VEVFLVRVVSLVDVVLHVVAVDEGVHQTASHQLPGRSGGEQTVGVCLKRVGGNVACGSHSTDYAVPDGLQEGGGLLTVRLAHLRGGIRLDSRLVRPDLEYLYLDTGFLQQVLVEHHFRAHALPGHVADGIEHHTVCQRADVIGPLTVGVGIGRDEFARILETLQCTAQLFKGGRRGGKAAGCETDAFDLVRRLGVGDDVEQLLERQVRTSLTCQGLEGERLGLFSQFPFQSDDDQRVVVDTDRGT